VSSRQVAETSEQQRRKKLNQIKREEARKHRRRMMVSVAAGVVIVLALAGGITWGVLASRPEKIALSGVQTFKVASRNHVTTPVKYAQTPPVGGDHNPTWLNCGIYDQPVPNENAVHDLEHGAVWITYRPDLPADQVAELQKLARSQTYITLSPYDGLSTPVVASAWGGAAQARGRLRRAAASVHRQVQAGPRDPGARRAVQRRHRHSNRVREDTRASVTTEGAVRGASLDRTGSPLPPLRVVRTVLLTVISTRTRSTGRSSTTPRRAGAPRLDGHNAEDNTSDVHRIDLPRWPQSRWACSRRPAPTALRARCRRVGSRRMSWANSTESPSTLSSSSTRGRARQ